MINKTYNDFLLRTNDKKLLRFSYSKNIGIFYYEINDSKYVEKEIISKNSLKYFYVFEDYSNNINIIYQDLKGNIILCILKENITTYRTIFYMKPNSISPISIKGFSLKNSSKYLYNFDSNSHKIYFGCDTNEASKIIYSDKNDIDINFKVLSGKEDNLLIIYSISFNIFKLVLKTYNEKNKKWANSKNIFITNLPYIDYSFYLINNKLHSLIIIDEVNIKKLIYKDNKIDKNEDIQREIIICEDYNLESCLIIEIGSVLWLLWINNKKMYGCYSLDCGESFSVPKEYLNKVEENIKKIEFIEERQNKEIYIRDNNGNVTLFLEELLQSNNSFDINYKEITYNFKEKKEISSVNKEEKDVNKTSIINMY